MRPSDQLPTITITTMAAAGGNGPLAPHMRPFVPRQCIDLIEDNSPSNRIGGDTPQDTVMATGMGTATAMAMAMAMAQQQQSNNNQLNAN